MPSNAIRFLSTAAIAVVATTWLAPAAHAQQVYRIVGADGKVSFTDQPPPPTSNAKVSHAGAGTNTPSVSPALPFELRQVAAKYPVTLYTSDNCQPCVMARTLLSSRGVPFTEKTVLTPDDIKALQRLSGNTALPFATIGGQQLNGFSDIDWTQFLNAAGYPAASVLPSGYRQKPATPLVVLASTPAPAPKADAEAPAPAAASDVPTSAGSNPAGIKF